MNKKYTTYYCSANGQPSNGIEEHSDINAALEAWKENIGGLIAGAGGESVLAFESLADRGRELKFISHCEGDFITGSACECWDDCEDLTVDFILDNSHLLEAE